MPPFHARAMAVLATLLLATACGSDDGSDPVDEVTVADLVGSWTASSLVYTNQADPSETFDLIANGGEVRVTVLTGGRARTWVDFGSFSDEWDAQLTMNGSTLTSTPAEASRPVQHFTFTLVGDVLTLTNQDDAFDFTLTGASPVAVTAVTVLERQ